MAEYIKRENVLSLIEYIKTKYIQNYNRKDKWTQFWADTIRYFEKKVRSLPTADVVEVKHGKWTKHLDEWDCEYAKCSACGEDYYDANGEDTIDMFYKFCPNCGAKMDLKGDHNG